MNKQIKRNDPCPCGSGQKYKKCCGAPICQSSDELRSHLIESAEFLIKSCILYDEGDVPEAKRMALEIRKILHDTGRCTSILSNLKLKNIKFINTSGGYNEKNLISTFSLTALRMSSYDGHADAQYVALLDDTSWNKLIFEGWWNDTIICDMERNTFSRKEIILYLADQDGGAHVDEEVERKYYNLTRNNTVGFNFFDGNEERPLKNVHMATVRQIAHEVIRTLESEINELSTNKYMNKYNNLMKENKENN